MPKTKGISDLALEMAQNTYKAKASQKNFSALIEALEAHVGEICLSSLHTTLQHDPKTLSPACQKAIEETFAIDSENPVALCVRDGYSSRSCLDAAESVQPLVLLGNSSPWDDATEKDSIDLDARLVETGNDSRIRRSEAEISQAEFTMSSNPAERGKLEPIIETALTEMLSLSCSRTRLSVRDNGNISSDPVERAMRDPAFRDSIKEMSEEDKATYFEELRRSFRISQEQTNASSTPSPLDSVESKLGGTSSAPKVPKLFRYDRSRFLGQTCERVSQRAIQMNLAKAAAICARFGKYHPNCIEELKTERKRKSMLKRMAQSNPAAKTTPKPKQGLDKF